jgi:hypothetical protein
MLALNQSGLNEVQNELVGSALMTELLLGNQPGFAVKSLIFFVLNSNVG